MSKENIILDELITDQGSFTTVLSEKYKNRKAWVRPDQRLILSYIPGTITSVLVKVGQDVKKGEPLLTFDAMKMANTYASPISGKISKVNVEAKQAVAKGVVLVEFE